VTIICQKRRKIIFFKQSGGAERATILDNATPAERNAVAQKLRSDYSTQNNSIMSSLDDDALLNILRTSHASATCEIIALTVPTPGNNHLAVSLYGGDNARISDMPLNKRGTALMKSSGHSLPSSQQNDDGKPSGVYGDVFVGRCVDDEITDVWERVDFTVEDTNPDASWCSLARTKGGGGGRGNAAAASLSGMMNQANFGVGQNDNKAQNNNFINNEEEGYTWNQSKEEVELKFSVAPGTKAKYVKIKFQRKYVKVVVAGQVLLEGETGENVTVDECTYTIQDDEAKTGRELCVTLGKQNNKQWGYAVRKKKIKV